MTVEAMTSLSAIEYSVDTIKWITAEVPKRNTQTRQMISMYFTKEGFQDFLKFKKDNYLDMVFRP